MTDLTTGMLTCLVTPAVRALALDYVRSSDASDLVNDRDELTRWFSEQESPNGTVLDASSSLEDALMIAVVARAIYHRHLYGEEAPLEELDPRDRDDEIRLLTR